MNRHEFQLAARSFRAGRLSLSEFTEKVFADKADAPRDQRSVACADPFVQLPQRSPQAHKNLCGHVLVIGGSREMPGAPTLTGLAALRGGAGLVTVASSSSARSMIAASSPCLMTADLGELDQDRDATSARDRLKPLLARVDVVALGPGMGQSDPAKQLSTWLYETLPLPMVIDADGLNNLAATQWDLGCHAGPRVLTPHVGEFRRLLAASGSHTEDTSRETLELCARRLAASNQIVVVLKGPASLVTDGDRHYHNKTGNQGLATAGTGDVLTGVIAALIGQGLEPFLAATTGCAIHGAAGDLAKERYGTLSMIASDVIESLGPAIMAMTR